MAKQEPRSLFDTTTARGALISGLAGLIVSLVPTCVSIAERRLPEYKDDAQDVGEIVIAIASFVVVGGTGLTLAGRASAKSLVYTPSWMPGYNKDELEEAYHHDPTAEPPRIAPDESAIAETIEKNEVNN